MNAMAKITKRQRERERESTDVFDGQENVSVTRVEQKGETELFISSNAILISGFSPLLVPVGWSKYHYIIANCSSQLEYISKNKLATEALLV